MIALDVEGISVNDVIIPESMFEVYGVDEEATLTDAQGNRYVVTGRQSDLPFTLTQLIIGVIAFMVAIAVVIGIAMAFANKKNVERMYKEMAEKEYK